jgi:1-aminocyclopropane-1-carboxylate deaminase/D-cysteine desulfhydrase-like pyridoxal-dependent ACC family enzyme
MIAQGRFAADEHLVFVHTGGLPGIWAYADRLLSSP